MVFAIFNLSFIPITYFFVPETAGRSLEDMDIIFAQAHHMKRNPVQVARDFKNVHVDIHQARVVLGFDDAGNLARSTANEMSGVVVKPAIPTAEHREVV